MDTEMVTTGPIRPLSRAKWVRRAPNHTDMASGLTCAGNHAMEVVDVGREHAYAVALNDIAEEMFPERANTEPLDGGDVGSFPYSLANVNDHPDTTFEDVCKILDEANRRLV